MIRFLKVRALFLHCDIKNPGTEVSFHLYTSVQFNYFVEYLGGNLVYFTGIMHTHIYTYMASIYTHVYMHTYMVNI